MPTDLPYTECYAVIEAVRKADCISGDYAFINVEVRNPENGVFRSNYDLVMKWFFSNSFTYPYGGEIDASAYKFSLSDLQNAAKTLKKISNKYEKLGGNKNVVTSIVNFLKAAKVKEVRIHGLGEEFHGWNHIQPITDMLGAQIRMEDVVARCMVYCQKEDV